MNNKYFRRFSGKFSLYLLIIVAVAAYPVYHFGNDTVVKGSIYNSIYFYIVTLGLFYLVVWGTQKTGTMVNAFLTSTVLKLLVSVVYLIFLLRLFPGHEIEFALTFFAAYLICTGFEVYYILYNLREI